MIQGVRSRPHPGPPCPGSAGRPPAARAGFLPGEPALPPFTAGRTHDRRPRPEDALARTAHSPACATAVVIVLRAPDPGTLVPLLAGAAVLIVLARCALSRARRTGGRHQQYWW
ncbi:hypothetical protein [Streptomyces sp. NRRL F-2664]|uniref:hypothetical protein n=1 Tax=Streptomyces sp. NRRL F-2664 TaxID=1463842 RepID=UPI000AF4F4B4|nr:hypothetical protein [Streptomyces sp. NRRL F-2664]